MLNLADGYVTIVLSDSRQVKEPLISLLAESKEPRDVSMHYPPGETIIWRTIQACITSAQ